MKKMFMFFWVVALPLCLQAANLKDTTHEIETKLNEFATTWNRGVINDVVSSYYKKSDETILISANTLHGYDEVLNFFQTNYPTQKEMGQISFSDIEVKTLSPIYSMGIGKWSATTEENKQFGGNFTVLYELTADGWKILIDHTTGL